jgi:arylsulfatase A-like enzyme
MQKQTKSHELSPSGKECPVVRGVWLLRTEVLIVLIGLGFTVGGKLLMLTRHKPPQFLAESVHVIYYDVLFFAALLLFFSCLYMLKPAVFTVRCALVMSVVVLVWSTMNFCWLVESGVQLQPGVVKALCHDFIDLWPIAKVHVLARMGNVVLLAMGITALFAYFVWCFVRPAKITTVRIYHVRRTGAIAVIIAALVLTRPLMALGGEENLARDMLGFSSHWYALVCIMSNVWTNRHSAVKTQNIAVAGQRQVAVPKCSSGDLPNMILVLLESTPYSATSLCNPESQTTPQLARLAHEGVEFQNTHVPVTHTTKVFWTVLTSTTPVIQEDYVEAVPVDSPYEGLPTILKKAGYRSGFFEMSAGKYECAPGFFKNLGFDWAWFRENLEDPSAHLGYMSGDDCRMLKPVFEWAVKGSQPFFLMMITSVTHDPFDVPASFSQPAATLYEKYLQTLRYTDYFLAQLCDELKKHGLDKNTLLCVLGDHGTSFRVQMGKGRWIPYEEVIRVPWVIWWPRHIKEGQKIDWPCSQLDVAPTLLELAGFDVSQANFEGRDALTVQNANRRFYFSSWYADSPIGFVEASRKVIYWPYLDKVFEYDLEADPNENSPLSVSGIQAEQIKKDIFDWQKKTQIVPEAKRFTEQFLFSHWRTFSTGSSAWAYYVP